MEKNKDNISPDQHIAVPISNSVDIDTFNEKEIKTEEDELTVGMGVLAETFSTKDISPLLEPSDAPLEGTIMNGDKSITKELGLTPIYKKGASKAQTILGMNTSRKLTLWHSGYNIGVGKFSQPAKTSLMIMLGVNQAEIGLNTAGIAFNNESAMFVKDVIEFLESLVELSTFKSQSPLGEALITDLPFITMLAMEESIGIVQVCDKCNARHELTAKWSDLIHVKRDAIDMNLLAKSKVSFKDREEYRKSYVTDTEESKLVIGNATYKFKIPTIEYYIYYGELWLKSVTRDVDAITSEATPSIKRSMLSTAFSIIKLQGYGHFIESITVGDETLTEAPDIIEYISLIDPVDNDEIIKHIKEFVKENTIAVVGVPAYKCTSCKEIVGNTDDVKQTFDNTIIPINIMMAFLSSTNHKLTELVK